MFRHTLIALVTVISLHVQVKQTYSVQDASSFTAVSLSQIANLPLEWLTNPPHGTVELGGVPFDLGNGGNTTFGTQVNNVETRPTQGILDNLNITNPKAVFILLSGGWVTQAAQGKKIGEFDFQFDNNKTYSFEVIAGVNIRETWQYVNSTENNLDQTIHTIIPSQVWQNVWQENQIRGGESAIAFLDLLTISLPIEYRDRTLKSITIRDTSKDQLLSPDPGMHIAGITVEHTMGSSNPPVETDPTQSFLSHFPFGESLEFTGTNCEILGENSDNNSGIRVLGITIDLIGNVYAADGTRLQCVSYVRQESNYGRRPDVVKWTYSPLDAKDWDNRARESGLEVISSPQLNQIRRNDIIVWENGDCGANQTYGHVAMVANVTESDIYIDDSNWNGDELQRYHVTLQPNRNDTAEDYLHQLGSCISIIHAPSQQWWVNQGTKFGRNCGLDPMKSNIVNCRALTIVANGNSFVAYFEVSTDGVENRSSDIRIDDGTPKASINAQFCGSTKVAAGLSASEDLILLQVCFVANEMSIGGLDLNNANNWLLAYGVK